MALLDRFRGRSAGGGSRALAEVEEQRLQFLEVRGAVWREVLDILLLRLEERRYPDGRPAPATDGDALAGLLADDAPAAADTAPPDDPQDDRT